MPSPAGEFDIAIVGAGPAGSVAARQLAIAGHNVLLVERAKFPRHKVCGCCVNAAAVETLTAIGLGHIFEQHHAVPLQAFEWHRSGRHVRLPLTGGFSLSRATLDQALVEAAIAAGVTFADQTSAVATKVNDDRRTITLRQDGRSSDIVAKVVIDAGGLGGSLAGDEPGIRLTVAPRSYMGLSAIASDCPPTIEPGVIYMADGPHGYVGAVRLEGDDAASDRMDIAAAVSPLFVQSCKGSADAVRAMFDHAGFAPLPSLDGLDALDWHGTPLMTRACSPPAAERIFLVGDAAGYVEPFTGEGIAWAIASGCAVVPHVLQALKNWSDDAVASWSASHAKLFAARQNRCRRFTRLLRGRIAPAGLMRLLGAFPSLASPVVRAMSRSYALPEPAPAPESASASAISRRQSMHTAGEGESR